MKVWRGGTKGRGESGGGKDRREGGRAGGQGGERIVKDVPKHIQPRTHAFACTLTGALAGGRSCTPKHASAHATAVPHTRTSANPRTHHAQRDDIHDKDVKHCTRVHTP